MESQTVPAFLDFRGPFPLWPEDKDHWTPGQAAACPGISLFTVKVRGQHRIYYVGEANHIADRLREHLTFYLAGKYLIYDPVALGNGELVRVWVPSTDTEHTLACLEEHRQKLTAMLGLVNIFFAEVHADTTVLCRLESALIRALRRNEEAKKFLENSRLSVARYDDHVLVEVRSASTLFAVPQVLSV